MKASLKTITNQLLPNEIFKWKNKNFVYRGEWIYIVNNDGTESQVTRIPEIRTKGRLQKALRESSFKV
jgi:hypothetical protein